MRMFLCLAVGLCIGWAAAGYFAYKSRPEMGSNVDVRAAVGHALKSASALIGEEEVLKVFRNMSGDTFDDVLKVDFPMKHRFRENFMDTTEKEINKLMRGVEGS